MEFELVKPCLNRVDSALWKTWWEEDGCTFILANDRAEKTTATFSISSFLRWRKRPTRRVGRRTGATRLKTKKKQSSSHARLRPQIRRTIHAHAHTHMSFTPPDSTNHSRVCPCAHVLYSAGRDEASMFLLLPLTQHMQNHRPTRWNKAGHRPYPHAWVWVWGRFIHIGGYG
jgi:hypothetical protein